MIKFSIHPTFGFIFLLALVHGFIYDVLLFFCIVLLHEIGHAYAALAFGWKVKKVELLPFGGVAEVENRGPGSTKEEMLIILAGPLVNVILLVIGCICLYASIGSTEMFQLFVEYNMIILFFNLLPIWPLDGGKLLQVFLSLLLPYKLALKYSLWTSIFFLLIYVSLVIFFFPVYFSLWIVAIFLCIAQWLEFRQSPYQFLRFIMNRYKHAHDREFQSKYDVASILLKSSQTVQAALEKMYRNKIHYYYLLNRRGDIIQVVSEKEMLEQYFEHHHTYRAVGEIFR